MVYPSAIGSESSAVLELEPFGWLIIAGMAVDWLLAAKKVTKISDFMEYLRDFLISDI